MKTFSYRSGDDVRPGDLVRYQGEPGTVDFVVTEKVGDQSMDWYLEQFAGGGFMIAAETFGQIFVTSADISMSIWS